MEVPAPGGSIPRRREFPHQRRLRHWSPERETSEEDPDDCKSPGPLVKLKPLGALLRPLVGAVATAVGRAATALRSAVIRSVGGFAQAVAQHLRNLRPEEGPRVDTSQNPATSRRMQRELEQEYEEDAWIHDLEFDILPLNGQPQGERRLEAAVPWTADGVFGPMRPPEEWTAPPRPGARRVLRPRVGEAARSEATPATGEGSRRSEAARSGTQSSIRGLSAREVQAARERLQQELRDAEMARRLQDEELRALQSTASPSEGWAGTRQDWVSEHQLRQSPPSAPSQPSASSLASSPLARPASEAPSGASPYEIRQLPTYLHRRSGRSSAPLCSICLEEYQVDDRLRRAAVHCRSSDTALDTEAREQRLLTLV
ncbi:hypothetical protein CYMTET_20682 [Cymbomonas tetramitiformis]|uniref:Uncharacterized protein n=1 Tax=Cymbomonas tetramitiformis TaxID=36881 RepID=A0AAE0G3I7_9CHLO|nr:hypothetical protein CYMTET_20682 [Cymbomonas tetramitiformis]